MCVCMCVCVDSEADDAAQAEGGRGEKSGTQGRNNRGGEQ